MEVGLFDIDSKIPNLVLMKLSAYWKAQGAKVVLNKKGDRNYASCVFTKNQQWAEDVAALNGADLSGWGSGQDYPLPDDTEHLCPDYDLYNINYSMGFTTRGCPRKCQFCIVPEKEGAIKENSPLSEFVRHKEVVLLDNNFLALPSAIDKMQEMIDRDLSVNFHGLDASFIRDEVAHYLAQLKTKRYRLAWDEMSFETTIRQGIKELVSHGVYHKQDIMVYMLCGFNTTWGEDWYRFKELDALGVLPFVMLYEGADKRLRHFARWANRGMYRWVDWEDYAPYTTYSKQLNLFK